MFRRWSEVLTLIGISYIFRAFQTLLVPPSPTFCHSCTVLLGSHNSVCTLVKELCPKANNFVYCYTSWVPDEIDNTYIVRNGCMTGTDVLNHMDQLENWPIAACQHLEMGEVMCVCRNGNFCNRNFLTKVPADFQTQLPTALDVEVSQGIPLMETITEKPKNQTWAERFEYKTEPNMTGNDKNISSPPYFWIPLARSTTSSFDDANLDDYEDVEETSSIIATPINEGENLSPDISIFVITALAKIYYT